MERISTGIEGLDQNLEGGFPRGSLNLLTGGPGSGKTTMCSHFIEKGLDNGDRCLFISTGQRPEGIRNCASDFGIDLESEELWTAHVSPSKDVADDIRRKIEEQSFDRIVLDSLSIFEMFWGEQDQLRKYINKLMEHFRELEATVLITSEMRKSDEGLTRFGIAEFLVDGVIELRGYALGNNQYRSARVIKMRRTEIGSSPLGLEIEDDGVKIRKLERI